MSTRLMPFTFGSINEGDDPKSLAPGSLLLADNCMMDKNHRLIKRRGTLGLVKTLLSGGNLASGRRLHTRGADVAINDGEFEVAYSPSLAAWQKIGRPPATRITRRSLVGSTRSAVSADIAVSNGMLISIFETGYALATAPLPGSPLFVQVEDLVTGAKILTPTLVSSSANTEATWSRVLVSGTTAIIVWSAFTGPTASAVWARTLDLTTFALGPITSITGSATMTGAGTYPADAAVSVVGGVPTLFVAFAAPGGGTNQMAVTSAPVSTLVVATTTTIASGASQTPTSVSIDANATQVCIAWGNLVGSATWLAVLNASTLAVTAGPTISGFTVQRPSGGLCVRIFDATYMLVGVCGADGAAALSGRLYTQRFSLAACAADATSLRTTYQAVAMSNMWTVNGKWYTACVLAPKYPSLIVNNAIPNATTALVEIETANSLSSVTGSPHAVAGTLENSTGWFATWRGQQASAVVVAGVSYLPTAYRNREPLNFQTIPIAWNLQRIEFNAGDGGRLASLGRGALVAAGAPYWFDGASVFPYAFAHAPMITSLARAAVGSPIAAGVYQYVAVYEWRDGNGVLHRSIPSPPATTVGVLAGDQITVAVTSSSHSQRQTPLYGTSNAKCGNPVSIALYRTTANGTVFYRLTLEPEYQILINDPTAGTVSLIDTKADADIGAGSPARPLNTMPQLYTSTGELADVPPPSLITVIRHGGRLAGIDGSLRMVWFTKDQTQDPLVAPGFNEVLTLSFGDDKNALAELDGKLVVFGTASIDLVFGSGPDVTGAGAWQSERMQTDVGCIEPRSVVTCPVGVLFRSIRGLELLSRGLEITWVGSTIRETLALYPTITSAVLVSDVEEVRFTCTSVDGLTGIVLAYDYGDVSRGAGTDKGAWFVRRYTDASDTLAANVPFVDAALINGVYTLLTAGGQVYQEAPTTNLDGGTTWVTRDIQLGWLNGVGNPVGWQRMKDVTLLGTSVTPHVLEISIGRDFVAAYEQVETFSEGVLGVTAVGPLQSARVTFKNQKVQASRVRLRDLPPLLANYGAGTGPIFEALAFRVGAKDGPAETSGSEQK